MTDCTNKTDFDGCALGEANCRCHPPVWKQPTIQQQLDVALAENERLKNSLSNNAGVLQQIAKGNHGISERTILTINGSIKLTVCEILNDADAALSNRSE